MLSNDRCYYVRPNKIYRTPSNNAIKQLTSIVNDSSRGKCVIQPSVKKIVGIKKNSSIDKERPLCEAPFHYNIIPQPYAQESICDLSYSNRSTIPSNRNQQQQHSCRNNRTQSVYTLNKENVPIMKQNPKQIESTRSKTPIQSKTPLQKFQSPTTRKVEMKQMNTRGCGSVSPLRCQQRPLSVLRSKEEEQHQLQDIVNSLKQNILTNIQEFTNKYSSPKPMDVLWKQNEQIKQLLSFKEPQPQLVLDNSSLKIKKNSGTLEGELRQEELRKQQILEEESLRLQKQLEYIKQQQMLLKQKQQVQEQQQPQLQKPQQYPQKKSQFQILQEKQYQHQLELEQQQQQLGLIQQQQWHSQQQQKASPKPATFQRYSPKSKENLMHGKSSPRNRDQLVTQIEDVLANVNKFYNQLQQKSSNNEIKNQQYSKPYSKQSEETDEEFITKSQITISNLSSITPAEVSANQNKKLNVSFESSLEQQQFDFFKGSDCRNTFGPLQLERALKSPKNQYDFTYNQNSPCQPEFDLNSSQKKKISPRQTPELYNTRNTKESGLKQELEISKQSIDSDVEIEEIESKKQSPPPKKLNSLETTQKYQAQSAGSQRYSNIKEDPPQLEIKTPQHKNVDLPTSSTHSNRYEQMMQQFQSIKNQTKQQSYVIETKKSVQMNDCHHISDFIIYSNPNNRESVQAQECKHKLITFQETLQSQDNFEQKNQQQQQNIKQEEIEKKQRNSENDIEMKYKSQNDNKTSSDSCYKYQSMQNDSGFKQKNQEEQKLIRKQQDLLNEVEITLQNSKEREKNEKNDESDCSVSINNFQSQQNIVRQLDYKDQQTKQDDSIDSCRQKSHSSFRRNNHQKSVTWKMDQDGQQQQPSQRSILQNQNEQSINFKIDFPKKKIPHFAEYMKNIEQSKSVKSSTEYQSDISYQDYNNKSTLDQSKNVIESVKSTESNGGYFFKQRTTSFTEFLKNKAQEQKAEQDESEFKYSDAPKYQIKSGISFLQYKQQSEN